MPQALHAALLLTLSFWIGVGLADQNYAPSDPLPPDAKGMVLQISGEVRTITGEDRTILGVASQVTGRIDPLAAALRDLGARTTDTELRIEMSADVLFDFDKANIKNEARSSLEKVATVLRSRTGSTVTIEGHTDAKGANAYNQKLSDRRAQAVQEWLIANEGLTNMKFVAKGFGAKKPVAPNTTPDGADDPAGRQKNRRVEIVVKNK